jgi:Flp pilus assembly protein TadD
MWNIATVLATPRTRRIRAAAMICFTLAIGGCALQSPFRLTGQLDYDESLVSGERLFAAPVPADELPNVAINEPSEAMLDYVANTVRERRLASQKVRDLFSGLDKDGYFKSVYSANRTLTAAETFEARGGNCLSYTNMFVSLARAAGLDARYQVVDVPPSWDADAGFLIRYTHINVLVRNINLEARPGHEVIVDFNIVHPDPDYPRREVSDEYAESLFYANQSVTLMRDKQPRESFSYLRRAIEIAPENIDLWINLGAFYATQGDFGSSLEAYDVALQLDPRNKAAFSGLARSYANVGNLEMAAVYEEKVRNYRQRNPYYHYALAQSAYEDADFESSLGYINTAIDLRRRTAQFHLLKGLVQQQLGDTEAARDSLRRAERYGLDRSVKLDLLRSLAGVNSS